MFVLMPRSYQSFHQPTPPPPVHTGVLLEFAAQIDRNRLPSAWLSSQTQESLTLSGTAYRSFSSFLFWFALWIDRPLIIAISSQCNVLIIVAACRCYFALFFVWVRFPISCNTLILIIAIVPIPGMVVVVVVVCYLFFVPLQLLSQSTPLQTRKSCEKERTTIPT